MKRLVVAMVAVAVLSVPAHACDQLRIMGFAESCTRACNAGWNAYDTMSCMWDTMVDW